MTACLLSLEEDIGSKEYYTRMGVSFCHRTEDRFTKKEGRDIALKRAMEEPALVEVPKWEKYQSRDLFSVGGVYHQRADNLYVRWRSYPFYSAAFMVEKLYGLRKEVYYECPSWMKSAPSWGENLAAALVRRFVRSPSCYFFTDKVPPVTAPVPKKGLLSRVARFFGLEE